MKRFSDAFVERNWRRYRRYGWRWARDPLAHWGRRWEYPFVHERIVDFERRLRGSPIRILDAGSGITFFPYYLREGNEQRTVVACDSDRGLGAVYGRVNLDAPRPVEFEEADIRALPFADGSFDVVYCISVLEHTDDYGTIIEGFGRVLKPDGLLILTVDVSLDGKGDVPIAGAERILECLGRRFEGDRADDAGLRELCSREDIVTTDHVRATDPRSLPWRYPLLTMAVRALTTGRVAPVFRSLTVYGEAFSRRGEGRKSGAVDEERGAARR